MVLYREMPKRAIYVPVIYSQVATQFNTARNLIYPILDVLYFQSLQAAAIEQIQIIDTSNKKTDRES